MTKMTEYEESDGLKTKMYDEELGEPCCGCDDKLWDDWTPTIYYFPHGTSLNRGCLCGWLCIDAPWTCLRICVGRLRHCLLGDPPYSMVVFFLLSVVYWVLFFCVATFFLFLTLGGLLCGSVMYVVCFIWELLCICGYSLTCGLCGNKGKEVSWRSFNCRGWIQPEAVPGRDPYTQTLWKEWSPFADCFDYNFPSVDV